MTHPTIYDLVQSTTTISSEYARDPSEEPGKITKRLYSHVRDTDESPPSNLGSFGSVPPSPLFLSIYHSILVNLAASGDVMAGMVSPPLIASSGVVPLTIVAPLPDIVKHMSNCIVRAKKEVFLATNFWINSDTSRIVTDALRELSKRAGERGDKVVVKVLYDRGNVKQAFEHHQHVPLSTYTNDKVNLPPPEEIPNIHMEVVNYHVPLLGTFHSKFMVVDRELALLMSNNIQDNDNLEMCVRLEGPIVDSLYDVCLASWSTTLNPPLPCRDSPAMSKPLPSYTDPSFLALFTKDSTKEPVDLSSVAQAGHDSLDLSEHLPGNPHYDTTIAGEIRRIQASYAPKPGETHLQAVSRHFNITKMQKADGGVQPTAPEPSSDSLVSSEEMTPYIPLPPSAFPGGEIGSPTPIPMLVASRAPLGTPTFSIPQAVKYPQNVAFLEAIRGAQKSIFIQTPNLNAEPLLPELVKAVRRGVQVEIWVCLGYNDAGELLPYQNGTNEMIANRLFNDPGLFTTTHQAHPSVPVVPNTKESMLTPNEAGDASQVAEPHRLNESDDLNANANVNANAQDVEAGSSELHPKEAQPLSEEEKSRLKIYNYVAKDQDKPIHNKFKKRSCHIKVLIVDSHLAIQGNGNQDTQTYFHSQEINVMLDSEEVCKRWMEGLRRNQNTEKYGLVSPLDGCWHDPKTGEMAEGAIGVDPGRFSWAKGVIGAVQRVRGAGGF